MGLIRFTQKGWIIAKELFLSFDKSKQDKLDMTSLLSILISKTKIGVVCVNGGWCEVDNYNDVLVYEEALANPEEWEHNWE